MLIELTTTTILLLFFGVKTSQVENSRNLQKGELSSPKVEWSCWRDKLHISINSSPGTLFYGIATAKASVRDYTARPQCSVRGNGAAVTLLVIDWHKHGNECGVYLDRDEGSISMRLEVHEHPTLLMSHDNTYNISCRLMENNNITTTLSSTTNSLLEADGLLVLQEDTPVIKSASLQYSPEKWHIKLEVVEQEQNASSLFLNRISTPQSIVEFGKLYKLIGSLHPSSVPFVLHSCWASPADSFSQQQHQKVLLVDEQGCSVDTNLLTEFHYLENQAIATIPSMFQFPIARTVRFECSYALCDTDSSKCRPDCKPLARSSGQKEPEDELEMMTELLGSGLEEPKDDLLPPSNHSWNTNSRASVVVHVIGRREAVDKHSIDSPPLIQNNVDTGASSPGCIAPADMMLLYKICIGLCFLFVLGCCCNIIFCCMSRNMGWSPKHKKKQNKRLAISTTGNFQHPQRLFSALTTTTSTLNPPSKNEFWIQDTGREPIEPSFYDSHYGQLPMAADCGGRRNSLTSYASVKQRSNRLHDSVHTTNFRLSNSGSDGVSIRPYGPPPSTSPSANSALRSAVCDHSSTYQPSANNTTFHTSLEGPTFSNTCSSVGSSLMAEEQETGDRTTNQFSPPIQELTVGAPHRNAPPPPPTTTFITMTGTQPNFKARPSGEYEVMTQEERSIPDRQISSRLTPNRTGQSSWPFGQGVPSMLRHWLYSALVFGRISLDFCLWSNQ